MKKRSRIILTTKEEPKINGYGTISFRWIPFSSPLTLRWKTQSGDSFWHREVYDENNHERSRNLITNLYKICWKCHKNYPSNQKMFDETVPNLPLKDHKILNNNNKGISPDSPSYCIWGLLETSFDKNVVLPEFVNYTLLYPRQLFPSD